MKIRYQELIQLYGFFKNAMENSEASFKEKRKMLKLVRAMEDDVNLATQEEKKIIEEFAERDSDGNIVTTDNGVRVSKENVVECSKRLSEIMSADVELDIDNLDHRFPEELFDSIKCSSETVALIEDNFVEE
jgi:hypothetical protein